MLSRWMGRGMDWLYRIRMKLPDLLMNSGMCTVEIRFHNDGERFPSRKSRYFRNS